MRSRLGSRRVRPSTEALEARACLAGVDALALGDVNGDQVADIAVAYHQGGQYKVTVYSGWGTPAKTTTGFNSLPLVTLTNPLGAKSGPLDVALGDFNGDGVSELAVASQKTASGGPEIGVWSFNLVNATPVNSPVTAAVLSQPFTPSGLAGATSLHLASADLTGIGRDELLVAPGGKAGASIQVRSYNAATSNWSLVSKIGDVPVSLTAGASISAGDVTGDGVADVVVGSKADGKFALYDGALDRFTWTASPFSSSNSGDLRVAVVAGVNQPGSIVATSFSTKAGAHVAVAPYAALTNHNVKLSSSPGSGALIPLGGGYVYQRSTVKNPTSSFPTSGGPTTPTVLFGATSSDQLLVQGFKSRTVPSTSPLDVAVEPLWAASTSGFTPLQPQAGSEATGQSGGNDIPINRIIYPKIVYHSPYSIVLPPISGVTPFAQGLLPYTSVQATSTSPWGPTKVPNVPPVVPSTLSSVQASQWLRERLIAAYAKFIGVDYQHHYDPSWQPTQGSLWNTTGTVAYQSQGVDCTNFTAYAYADALGITMNSATGTQAAITPQNLQGTVIPASILPYLDIKTIAKSSNYNAFVAQLQPGDILYINGDPSNPSKATHAITWLGQYGVDTKTGKSVPLIIDSTGITPEHIDSNNHVVPEGVHIRPFGNATSDNSWYFKHVDHVLRLIAN